MNVDWYLSHVFTDDDGVLQVVAKRRLRPDARMRIEKAQKFINEYYASSNVIDALLKNRNEIFLDIVNLTSNYRPGSSDTELLMDECLSGISRHLANTCSLFMSLIEHFNRFYKIKYGRKSDEYIKWKEIIDDYLNKSSDYCIMYSMRNYIQHVDMPPIGVSIKEQNDIDNIEFSFELDIDSLRQDERCKNDLRPFQENLLAKIPIIQLLDGWSTCIDRLVKQIQIDMRKRTIRQAYIIAKLRSRLSIGSSGRIVIIPIPRSKSKIETLTLQMPWLPEEKAKRIIDAR